VRRRRSPHNRRTCEHCRRVNALGADYQATRAAWESQLEAVAAGYPTETAEARQATPGPLFRDYLVQLTGSGWPMSGRAPRRQLVDA
jgi:hypothetical protein